MKISIITACFNSAATIENTIKSVISQGYEDIEYILIDGGSKDNTMNIVNQYKKYFTYIISEKDKGVADAFNKGILAATGDIIGIINADDIMYPGTAKKIKEVFDRNIDVYYGDKIVFDEKNNSRCYQKALPLKNIEYCLPFCHQSVYISKNCYNKYGFYSLDYKLCLDYELILKMYKGGAKFKYIEFPFCVYSFGGCTYINPNATIKENLGIAVGNGLPHYRAFIFKIYYLSLCYGKRFLRKIRLLKFFRNIRQQFNKDLNYNTKF